MTINLRQQGLPAIAMLVTAMAYIPSVASHYYQDDWGHLASVTAPHFNPWVPGHWFYRPIFLFVFAQLYNVFGLYAPAWHIVALAVHLVNVFLVYKLAMRFGFGALASACGAAVYGVFPVTTDAVMWLSALSGLMAATLCLIAAHIAVDHRMPPLLRGVLCAAVWTAALFAKEEAASLIFVLPILPLLTPVKRSRAELAQWAPMFLLLAAGVWLLLHFEQQCDQHLANVRAVISINLLRRAVTAALWNIDVLPITLSSTVLGAAGVLAIPVVMWSRYPRLRPGLLWFCGSAYTLGVVLGTLCPAGRYVYIPSVGLGLTMAALVERLQSQDGAISSPTRILLSMLACCALGSLLPLCILLPACLALYMLRNDGPAASTHSGSACLALLATGLLYAAIRQVKHVFWPGELPAVLSIVMPLTLTMLIAFVTKARTGRPGPWQEMSVISVLAFAGSAPGILEVTAGIVLIEILAARSSMVARLQSGWSSQRKCVRNYSIVFPIVLIIATWMVCTTAANNARRNIGQYTWHLVKSGAAIMRNIPRGANVECVDDACLSCPEPRVLAVMTELVARRPDLSTKWAAKADYPGRGSSELADTAAYRIWFHADGNVSLASPMANSPGRRGNTN